MIGVAKRYGADDLFAFDDFLFIPGRLMKPVFDFVFAERGFFILATENGIDLQDLIIIVIHLQLAGIQDTQEIPHIWICFVSGDSVFSKLQVNDVAGFGVDGSGII